MAARNLILGAVLALASAGQAKARPVTDCPNRDAPFSASSPLIDILLSDAARDMLNRHSAAKFGKTPDGFFGTRPPSFAAIQTLATASRFTGMDAAAIAAADKELSTLPVTEADRIARCARYDNDVPTLPRLTGKVRILLFDKINGFRDAPSVDAARAALVALAERKGWSIAASDKGGAFNARTLKQFNVVIWNNVSGDVLTLAQRRAFRRYMEGGGGFVGLHGTAGDPNYWWDWFADRLIGARFLGHPREPQFQDARIVANPAHPIAASLPPEWRMTDEWYSFRTNPVQAGAKVVLSIDEASYMPVGAGGVDLRMGSHPLAWTNCIGRGRMFYSAIGHRPETYSQPENVAMLEATLQWAALDRSSCPNRTPK